MLGSIPKKLFRTVFLFVSHKKDMRASARKSTDACKHIVGGAAVIIHQTSGQFNNNDSDYAYEE